MIKNPFRKKDDSEVVFIIGLNVTRAENSIMPEGVSAAYVTCYSGGVTYIEATENVLRKLVEDGLYPEEIIQPIHQMPISEWSTHAKDQWPELANALYSQSEFQSLICSGKVVYGPFGAYNPINV